MGNSAWVMRNEKSVNGRMMAVNEAFQIIAGLNTHRFLKIKNPAKPLSSQRNKFYHSLDSCAFAG
jgi:hypothetical protein